ncbi:MAG: YhfC family glutamic-type intramembrane protease [Tissierellia bacterium]|nr:YhfC family glutamic-type intramembrane protease [Tissierellia bacterium]
MKYLKVFLLGLFSFFISQILIRFQILNYLSHSINFNLIIADHILFAIFFYAFTAGVFEELGRFIIRKFFLKEESALKYAMVFGVGHSFMEILWLFYKFGITGLHPLAYYERIVVTIVHICLSIVIWEGFNKKSELKYLIIAILIHTVFDFMPYRSNPFLMEFIISFETILLLIYVAKLYRNRRKENEIY